MSLKLDLDCFSTAGKISAEQLIRISNQSKYKFGKDMFEPDKNWQINNYLCDNEQIEKECHLNIDELKRNIKRNCMAKKREEKLKNGGNANRNKNEEDKGNFNLKKALQGIKYKYHNNHLSRVEHLKKEKILKKFNEPKQTTYSPKYEYLYPKIIGGKWSNLSFKRNNLIINQNNNLSDPDPYYHKDNIKGFVDMSKQSNRKEMIGKKFSGKAINFNIKVPLNNRNNYPFLLLISKTNDEDLLIDSENDFSISNRKINLKKNKSAPDFNRYLSREYISNLFKKNRRIINGDLTPNYKSIESSNKMMVVYNRSRNHKLKDNRSLSAVRQKIKYNVNEKFEKIYGNKLKLVPNFEKMTPRKKGNLPFFLNGLTNRYIYSISNDKSLKMNNYSDRKMYNLCGDMKKNPNKYKSNKILDVRKYFSFNNVNIQNKKKVLNELKEQIKKFNRLSLNNENNNFDNYW